MPPQGPQLSQVAGVRVMRVLSKLELQGREEVGIKIALHKEGVVHGAGGVVFRCEHGKSRLAPRRLNDRAKRSCHKALGKRFPAQIRCARATAEETERRC